MDAQTQDGGPSTPMEAGARRQAAQALALAEEAEPALRGPDQVAWLDRLEGEYDAIQQALDWSAAAPTPERIDTGLRIAGALKIYWEEHGRLTAGRDWLARLLAAAEALPAPPPALVMAKAVEAAARLAYKQGDLAEARPLYTDSLARYRSLDSPAGVALSLGGLGNLARLGGDLPAARAHYDEALALRRAMGDLPGVGAGLFLLGHVAVAEGDLARGARLYEESLALSREIGDSDGEAYAHEALGQVAFVASDHAGAVRHTTAAAAGYRALGAKANLGDALDGLGWLTAHTGDYAQAAVLLDEAVAAAQEAEGNPADAGWALAHLGIVAARLGEPARAHALLTQCLTLLRGAPDPPPAMVGLCLLGFADLAAAERQPARLAQLTAAAEALYEGASPVDRAFAEAEFTRCRAAIAAGLDPAAAAAARTTGRSWTMEQAIARALEEPPEA